MEEIGESHAFHRMSSQRRRKLWSLAARAAAKCPDETEKTKVSQPTTDTTAGASPFWSKDSLVKTQDSGVSVDLHSDGLQCGSMNASFTSAQQRASFEAKNPSHSPVQMKFSRTAPRRLHSDQGCGPSNQGLRLRPKVGSELSPRDVPTTSAALDTYDPSLWRIPRNFPSRKRKTSSQQWGSADTSGLGSSLDWASVDVTQQPQIRHFSTSFSPYPKRLPGNPVAMRSLDETNLHSSLGGLYLQTPTACLGSGIQPQLTAHGSERGITSIHSSPIGPHRFVRSLQPRSHFIPSGESDFQTGVASHPPSIDRFGDISYPGVPPVPFLVTRSLDQADPQHYPSGSASPSIAKETIHYHSVPVSIGHSAVAGLTHINPRYAYSSMHSGQHEYANIGRPHVTADRRYHQTSSFVPSPASVPRVGPTYRPKYPVSPCELCPQVDSVYSSEFGRRRTMEYYSPMLPTELQRSGRSTDRGQIYRRSRTLEESSGSQPRRISGHHHHHHHHHPHHQHPHLGQHHPLIMYSVPPPTDETDPYFSRELGHDPRLAHRAPSWYDVEPDTGSQQAGRVPALESTHIVLPHRMRYSHEETIMEDWDAEQDRRAQAPISTVRHSGPHDGKEPPIVRTLHPATGSTPSELRVLGRKRPRESSPPLSRAQTHPGSKEITVARRIVPLGSGPSSVVRAQTVDDDFSYRHSDHVSHSKERSGDHFDESPIPESSTRIPDIAEADQPRPASSASSSSELRCLQVPHIKIRSTISSSDRPLVNPAFWALPSDKHKHAMAADSAPRLEISELGEKVPDTTDRAQKPLQSVLKNRGPDSSRDYKRPRKPEKSVSLEEKHSMVDEPTEQVDHGREPKSTLLSKTASHLFVDSLVADGEKDEKDYTDGMAPAATSEALIESVPPTTGPVSVRLSQAVSGTTSLGGRGAAAPYDHSRLAIHISTAEVEQFAEYWDHSVFATARITALGLATVATVCLICSAGVSTWIYHGTGLNITHSGFWKRCNYQNQTCQLTIPFLTKRDGWQDGALCILILAILLGILGTSLALAGHVVFALSKRLYYFHSSGEAHVVAAFVTALSTLVFHVTAVVHLQTDLPIRFGAGYGITWFACFLHLVCALLLSLDEVLHRLAVQSSRVACIRVCMHCLIRCYGRVLARHRAMQTSQALRRKRKLEARTR